MQDNNNETPQDEPNVTDEASDGIGANGTNEAESAAAPKSGSTRLTDAFEWIEMFAIYFAIGISVFLLLFRHCPVVGASMNETLQDGDLLIVTDLLYSPEAGDIIVCQSQKYGLEKPLVKRIIATAGQTVSIDYKIWSVTVDGVALDEDYVKFIQGAPMLPSDHLEDTFTVPEGMLFVMGDNRNNSKDSRSSEIGFIDERYVVGKVALRLLPISEITVF